MASSPNEMAIFERVAARGSFAGAAKDAGLSPSAAAKLITRLEHRLGARPKSPSRARKACHDLAGQRRGAAWPPDT
jgi:molybdenum-dependent DNA-binding transcriptional regulator ModE